MGDFERSTSNRKYRRPFSDDVGTEGFYDRGLGEQQELLEEQDETLKALRGGIDRVGQMAVTINKELDHHNQIIRDIDEHIDRTETTLSAMQRKLSALAGDSDRGKYCTICVLTVVLVMLFWLVVND